MKLLYQEQQPGCLFFEANFVIIFLVTLQLGEKQINIQRVCFSQDLGKLAVDLQIHSSVLFVFMQEDFSNNKNITRDNRHLSVCVCVFFLHKKNIGYNKITIKDNRQGACFLRLEVFAKFFEEIILIRNYCLKLF